MCETKIPFYFVSLFWYWSFLLQCWRSMTAPEQLAKSRSSRRSRSWLSCSASRRSWRRRVRWQLLPDLLEPDQEQLPELPLPRDTCHRHPHPRRPTRSRWGLSQWQCITGVSERGLQVVWNIWRRRILFSCLQFKILNVKKTMYYWKHGHDKNNKGMTKL